MIFPFHWFPAWWQFLQPSVVLPGSFPSQKVTQVCLLWLARGILSIRTGWRAGEKVLCRPPRGQEVPPMSLPTWSAVGNPKRWAYGCVSYFELLGTWWNCRYPHLLFPETSYLRWQRTLSSLWGKRKSDGKKWENKLIFKMYLKLGMW